MAPGGGFGGAGGGLEDPDLPDMSHLSPEEQAIIMEVMRKQKAEEQQEQHHQQKADVELRDIERQINERKDNAMKLVGTVDDAICQICQKTKFADGIGHKCFYCQLRSCARCGGKTKSKEKIIWACSLCQKRQQLLARTGKWFQQNPQGQLQQNSSYQDLASLQEPSTANKAKIFSDPSTPTSATGGIPIQVPSVRIVAGEVPSGSPLPVNGQHQPSSRTSISGSAAISEVARRGTTTTASSGSSATARRQNSLRKQTSIEQQTPERHMVNGSPSSLARSSLANSDGLPIVQQPSRNSPTTSSAPTTILQQKPGNHIAATGSAAPKLDSSQQRSIIPSTSGGGVENVPGMKVQQPQNIGPALTSATTVGNKSQLRLLQKTASISSPNSTSALPSVQQQQQQKQTSSQRIGVNIAIATGSTSHSVSSSTLAEKQRSQQQQQNERLSDPSVCSAFNATNVVGEREQGLAISTRTQSGGQKQQPVDPKPVVIPPACPPTDDRPSTIATAISKQQITTIVIQKTHTRQQPHESSSSDEELNKKLAAAQSTITAYPSSDVAPNDPLYCPPSTAVEHDFSEKDMLKYIYDQQKPLSSVTATTSNQLNQPLFLRNTEGGLAEAQSWSNNRLNFHQRHPSTSSATIMAGQDVGGALTLNALNPISPLSPTQLHQRTPMTTTLGFGRNDTFTGPVSWRPSADQQYLIGRIVLFREQISSSTTGSQHEASSSIDGFGLKIVSARTNNGKLGAFISRIKPGSVADTLGQLKAGDEVLEWNGTCMQNLSPEAIYNVVQASKGDQKLELIVARSLQSAGRFHHPLLLERQFSDFGTGAYPNNTFDSTSVGVVGGSLPHSQSLMAGPFQQQQQQRFYHHITPPGGLKGRSDTPLVFHPISYVTPGGSFQNYVEPIPVLPSNPALISSPRDSFTGRGGGSVASTATNNNNIQICGQLEVSLLYLAQKRELVVSLHRALDLLPRDNGSLRNAYVKIFLLPDRSEKSRRQSKMVPETLSPIWDEFFVYESVSDSALFNRVLELTVWDYDLCDQHNFLGEALIDLATAPLNNHPYLYTVLDTDEENPIRAKLIARQRLQRLGSVTPPTGARSHSYSYGPRIAARINHHQDLRELDFFGGGGGSSGEYYSDYKSSRRSNRSRRLMEGFAEDEVMDWSKNNANNSGGGPPLLNGYISDRGDWNDHHLDNKPHSSRQYGTLDNSSGRQHRRHHGKHHRERRNDGANNHSRRPHSATTADRTTAEYEDEYGRERQHRDFGDPTRQKSNKSRSTKTEQLSGNNKEMDSQRKQQYSDFDGAAASGYPEDIVPTTRRSNSKKMTRQQELQMIGGGEYGGSDGSAETISINSAQSFQNKTMNNRQHHRQQHPQQVVGTASQPQQAMMMATSSVEDNDQYGMGGGGQNYHQRHPYQAESSYDPDEYDDTGAGIQGGHSGDGSPHQTAKAMMMDAKDRKKSLMTRLIPGRTGIDNSKRTGFARSEEVGIPGSGGGLSIPQQNAFTKQTSKESNDSSDSNMPIIADTRLDAFVKGLGMGQIVGRQAVVSQRMGDLKVGISLERDNEVRVHVYDARNLAIQSGKSVPAIYVKAYLLEGKSCLAKGKTHPMKPDGGTGLVIDETIAFVENPKLKMVQLIVLGDHGRFERRSFLGVAQIALDRIQLGPRQQISTYKLYSMDSLNGGGGGSGGSGISGPPHQQNSNESFG